MVTPAKTLWLQPDDGGCGHCVSTGDEPACAGPESLPCAQPRLEGEAVALTRALAALRQVADADGNLVDTQRFSALRVDADEVELHLTFPRHCGPTRLLAEDAFQALRRALPDTDVYVLLAG
jgi:hypothetical protein